MLKNVGAQWVRTVVFIIAGLLVPPLMYRHLGKTTYGTWELVISITGMIKLLALGIPMASVRMVAKYGASGDPAKLNTAIGTCARIYIGIGALALAAGAGLYAFFEIVYLPTSVAPDVATQARIAFGLIVLHVSCSFMMQLPYSIMAGHERFVRQNQIMIGILLFRIAMIVTVLLTGGSLVLLAAIEIVTLFIEFLLPWRFLRREYPAIRIRFSDYDGGMMRQVFSFGGYIMILNVGMRLVFQTDALVIGRGMDTASVVDYARANTFLIYLVELMIAIAAVIVPLATKLKTEDRVPELNGILLKWTKIAFSLSLLVGIYLLVLGPEFIGWWMGDNAFVKTTGQVLPVLVLSSLLFLPVRAVAMPMLFGLGNVRYPALLFLATGAVNLGISIALVKPYGLFGVALGTAIPNAIYSCMVLPYACRSIGASLKEFLSYVVPRCLMGAAPLAALLWWAKDRFDISGFVGLFSAGIIFVALFAIVWIFFVYRGDPHVDLKGRLGGLLGKGRP